MLGKRVKFTKANIDWEVSNANRGCYSSTNHIDDTQYNKNMMVVLYQLMFPAEYPGVIVGMGGTPDTYKVKFNFGFVSYYETKDLKVKRC